MKKIFLCAFLLSAAAGALAALAPRQPFEARIVGATCGDCRTLLVPGATDGEDPVETPCGSGEVCFQAEGTDGTDAFCAPKGSVTVCNTCSGQTSAKDFQCDDYNDAILWQCAEGGGVQGDPITCPTDEKCWQGSCKPAGEVPTPPPPSNTCDESNVGHEVAVQPACTSYARCTGDGTWGPETPCPAGQYYDQVNVKGCTPEPPTPCTGCEGKCSDPEDCRAFHFCQGGQVVYSNMCRSGETFDYGKKQCQAHGECDPRFYCEFGSGGTNSQSGDDTISSASDCDKDGQMLADPAEGECTQWYYVCKSTASGGYYLERRECPGILYFNPVGSVCDLESNVAGCP